MQRLAAVPIVAVLVAGIVVPAYAAERDYFTYLRPGSHYPAARGDSEYERHGARRELEVTVTGIARLVGRRVSVSVNGHKIGTIRVSSRGRAHREWSTAHGQSVPSAGTGSRLQVRTAGGTLIASGTYRLETED